MEQLEEEIQVVAGDQIRPLVKAHHGGIEPTRIEGGDVVGLRILGACASCPGAEHTVNDIIVASVLESCPGVSDDQVVAGISEGLAQEAPRFLKEHTR
jgi:Fe-S cluster biogenesis protein NfuA